MPQEIAQTGRAAVETGDVPETGNDFHAQILPPERPGDKARENSRSGKRSGLPARSAPHLRVAVFTARQNGIAELESLFFIAGTMSDVAMSAGNRGRVFFRIEILVVLVVFKARFANIVQMAFDAGFILHRDDDDGGLPRRRD